MEVMSRNISYGSQRSAWTRKRKSPEQCQPTFMLVKHNQEEDDSLDSAWYDHWVLSQISSQPVTLYETIATGDDSDTGADAQAAFHDVWTRTGQYFLEHQSPSVKEIVEHLENVGLLLMCEKEEVTSVSLDLVLAIIGWQTMLFRLDMGSAHPSQIAIVDETDGYRTNAHQRTRQERSGCRSDLHVLLKGFGQVLPSAANPPSVSEDDKPAIAQYRFAAPGTFNAHILSTMAEVEFRWTDSLACHLDFDKSSNVVWLYRFPGFCMLHLRSNSNKGPIRSVLHAAALPSNVSAGKYWASYDEVDEYLREVVLSFRLLFGQKKASRRFFRSLKRARPQDPETEDPFLQKLCSDESFCEGSRQQDRRIYELSADFPLMREKICLLQMHLSIRRPRTWRQLWADKRDSANWYTFWAVLVIGGSGILLGMMQVVLQIVQVAQTARSSP